MEKESVPLRPFTLTKEREQQILDKLDNSVHSEIEYKKIVASLEQQNMRLREQLKLVGDKVLKLLQKKKIAKTQNTRAIQSQIIQAKAQLQARYKQFDQFKQEVHNTKNQVQQNLLNDKYMKFSSELKQIDRDLKMLRQEKKLLEGNAKQLNTALGEYNKEEMPEKEKLEELVRENKELRKKAMTERRKDDKIDQESIKVQQSLVTLQQKVRRAAKPELQQRTLKSLKTATYDKSQILNKTLTQEIEQLKIKKNQRIDSEQKKKNELTAHKTELYNTNQQLWDRSKRLEMQKIKLLHEYNKYESFLMEQANSKKRPPKEGPKQTATQTDPVELLFRLRRDYAGILGKIRFDDRVSVLKSNFACKIFKILVFENEKGIAAVKFSYFNSEDSKQILQGVTPVSAAYLQKCKKRSFEVEPPNFFKLFKIKSNTLQKRITKFEIIANNSEKSEFGQKKLFEVFDKDDAVYSFDINTQEYPASMFGSLQQIGQEWYLQSLGAEIRDSLEPVSKQQTQNEFN